MRKIYRLDSDYTTDEINEIISNIPKDTKDILVKFADSLDLIAEICLKEDGTYCKTDGKEIMIVVLYECEKERMIELTDLVYDRTKYNIKDISEEVLFGKHTEKDYPGVEEKVKEVFDTYLDMYLDHDVVLDKINMYGMPSLSERDKKVLESENI
jgi:hypothetical protein